MTTRVCKACGGKFVIRNQFDDPNLCGECCKVEQPQVTQETYQNQTEQKERE